MKYFRLVALLILTAIPVSAQINWPHNDFDAGLILQRDFFGGDEQFISDDAGGYWITYVLFTTGGASTDSIRIQHVDRNGLWLFPETGTIPSIGVEDAASYAIIRDGSGGIILFYYVRNEILIRPVLTAQRINAAGQLLWGANGKVISDHIGHTTASPLHPLYSMGNFYVSWFLYDSLDISVANVKTQRINGSGDRQWGLNGVNSAAQSWHSTSLTKFQTAEDGNGGIAMLFEHGDTLFWQQFNSSGSRKFNIPPRVNLFTKLTGHAFSDIIYNSNEWYFAFEDTRYGNNNGSDIYLQKVLPTTSSSTIQTLWKNADSGKAICKYPGSQYSPRLTSDGQNGLIISWIDNRNIMQQGKPQVFAQRWATSDNYLWNNNGVQVSSNYFSPVIAFTDPIPHRNGIVFPMWESEIGISAQKMNMLGSLQWYSPLGKIHSAKNIMLMNSAPQGNENTIIVYRDYFDKSVRVKLLDKFGYLGDNAPRINDVKDIINDQGGKLSVLFNASWQEANPPSGQFSNNFLYRIYRGISARNLPEGAVVHTPEMESGSLKGALIDLSTTTSSGESIFWEQVSEVAPLGVNGYSKVVSSTTDSGRQGIPWNYFMTSYGNFSNFPQIVWYSNIDSGYSVDNLPPYPPQIPAGAFTGGSVRLHWKKNLEEDLAGYEVYRSTSPSIVSDEQNLIAAVGDTLYQDGTVLSNTNYYYIIKAVDIHGNKSGNSSLVSLNVLSVSGNSNALPTEYALDQNYPNPFNPATNISFALPAASFVSLRVFDAIGREVESLVNEFRSAGRYTVPFGGGQLSSGLYICEVRTEQFTKRIKMNLIK
jgi:hypothetical protein